MIDSSFPSGATISPWVLLSPMTASLGWFALTNPPSLDNFVAKMIPEKATGDRNAISQNRSIVQNNVFNNEFNGDTPVQQKASRSMDKSTARRCR